MASGYPSSSSLDKVFANAVKWAQFSGLSPILLSPTNTGAFSNGVWIGSFTVSNLAEGVFLETDDGHLNAAFSNPFSVGVVNDVGLTMVLSNNLAIAGEPLTFILTLTNIGPGTASGVRLTNTFPTGTSLVGVTASQGTCVTNGLNVVCDVGTMTNESSVRVTLTLIANQAGTITNFATATRAEPDFYIENNSASVSATVIPPASFYINDASVVEGNTGITNAIFEVKLFPPSSQTCYVHYATMDASAITGLDYISTNGLLTFPPGITNQFITVSVKGDLVSEDAEEFLVQLANPTNALIANSAAVGSILDDNDPLPIIYVETASATEGDTGTNVLVLTAQLSSASGKTVVAAFEIGSGTAIVGSDLEPMSGQLLFPPGVTNQTFQVSIRGDTVNEPDEFFFVNISVVSNAVAAFAQSSGVILNDDGNPGKLDHFEFGPLLAPVVQGQPFWLSVEAKDAWNYALASINSPFAMDGFSNHSTNPVEILTWTRWVLGGRYPQILTAISNAFTDFHEVSTTTLDPLVLEALLMNKDVFLVPPQGAPTGYMGVLGSSWATVLHRFVERGGVVIVCSDNYDEHLLLANSGFLQLQRLGNDFSGNVILGSASRVTEGVSNSFTGSFVSTYAATNGTVALRTATGNYAVVIQREVGIGGVFMIGSGFFSPGSQMDRILANAVRWNYGTAQMPVSLTSSTSLVLTNGHWAAPVVIPQFGERISIRASDSLGRSGWTGFFDVAVDSDGDGMPDAWENSFGLRTNDLTDATEDADGDGASNAAEYLAGTNPLLSESVLNITVVSTGPELILEFPSSAGRHYLIEYTEDLIAPHWETLGEPFTGTAGLTQIIIPISGKQIIFFRVRLIM